MDYFKIYDSLITRGKNRVINEYTENHHIIPRCRGGNDSKDNLTMLTAREHFIAHWLLTKMYPDDDLLSYALMMMCRDPKSQRRISSRMFDVAKKHFARMQSKRQTENNMMWTESARKKTSDRMKGDGNPIRKFPEKNPFLGKSYVVGRKWYNNGIENLYLYQNEIIPDGFVPGMKFQKRKKKSKLDEG